MKKKLILIITLFFLSCEDNKKLNIVVKETVTNINNTKNQDSEKNNGFSINDTIFNDDFIFRIIDDSRLINPIEWKFEIKKIEVSKNKHNIDLIDSIQYYNKKSDSLIIFKSVESKIIKYLSLNDGNFHLIKSLTEIGIKKNELEKYFSHKISSNKLVVSDIEKGNIVVLEFEKDRLKKIIYRLVYLD